MFKKASPLLCVTAFQLNESSVGLGLQEILKCLSLYILVIIYCFAPLYAAFFSLSEKYQPF